MPKRYHSLDSLRGIASLQVLVSHSLMAVPFLNPIVYNNPNDHPENFIFYLTNSPISFLWCDSAAVKVFFVLSGFVLSVPYYTANRSDPHYTSYFVKRITRLYLPCLAIILISLLCKKIFYTPNEVNNFGEWIKTMWTLPVDSKVLIELLILNFNLDYFDRALWTLPVEIKLSIILPFSIYITRSLNKTLSLLFLIAYIIIWHILNKIGARNVWSDFPVLYYFTYFLLGSLICKYRIIITDWINNITSWQYYLLVIVMIYLYTFKYSMTWLPTNLYMILQGKNDYISAIAALLILCISLSTKSEKILHSNLLIFFGRISFSLYLVHMIVITTFAYLLHNYLETETTVCLAVLSCFPIAIFFYNTIEIPSLKFANYLANSRLVRNFHFLNNNQIKKNSKSSNSLPNKMLR